MNRLLAVLCSLLMVTAISGTGIANGEVNSQPSASQNQAQPNGAMQPSEMGTTGAGPMQNNQEVMQGTQGTQMQMQQMDSTGAMMGAGPGGMQMCPMGSLAVDDNSIYVLRGNQLLRYNKSDMSLVGTTMLPAPAQTMTPPTPGAAGQGPGICPSGVITPSGAGPAPVIIRTDLTPRPAFQQMTQNMQQMAPCDLDKAYLQTMIQAHCGSIEWSNLANSKASRSDLRRFAGRIADDESQMSMRFSSLLHDWYGVSSRNCERSSAMDEEVLNRLQTLSGRNFDIAYMQAMIAHLSEAIVLSTDVQQRAAHPELKTTAANMINNHNADIQRLRRWAADWYGVSI